MVKILAMFCGVEEGLTGQLKMWGFEHLTFFRLSCQLFPQYVAQFCTLRLDRRAQMLTDPLLN